MRTLIAAATLALAFAPLAARADHPCRADVERLCKGVEPGGGRIVKCLEQHQAELSAACKERRASAEEKGRAAHHAIEACKDDTARLCAGVKPGKGRIVQCLKSHQGELAAGCAAALAGGK